MVAQEEKGEKKPEEMGTAQVELPVEPDHVESADQIEVLRLAHVTERMTQWFCKSRQQGK
eukprot:6469622-Amphidinium_carterae.1